jgi:ATP-dependent Clp protease ATP-binding subunit ClpC
VLGWRGVSCDAATPSSGCSLLDLTFLDTLVDGSWPAERTQQEATRLGHTYTGTEQVLVGLLAEAHGPAALALGELGLDLDRARQELVRLAGEGEGLPPGVQVGLTAQAKQMIEQTTRAVLDRHAQEVGTEHLLLGLLAVDDAACAHTSPKNQRQRRACMTPAQESNLSQASPGLSALDACARQPGPVLAL